MPYKTQLKNLRIYSDQIDHFLRVLDLKKYSDNEDLESNLVPTQEQEEELFSEQEDDIKLLSESELETQSIFEALEKNLKKEYEEQFEKQEHDLNEPKKKPRKEKGGILKPVLQFLLRFMDELGEDILSVVKNKIPPYIFPILSGALGFIFLFMEGWSVGKEVIADYRKNKKVDVLIGASSFALCGAGAGMSLALFLNAAAGIAISGAPILSVLVSSFFTGVFALALFKHVRHLNHTKQERKNSLEDLQKFEEDNFPKIIQLKKQIEKSKERNEDVRLLQKKYYELEGELYAKKIKCEYYNREYFYAKKDVMFSAINVFASSLVTVAAFVGTAGILAAASIASFGAIPLIVGLIGATISICNTVFKAIDAKRNYALSNDFLSRDKELDLTESTPIFWKQRSPTPKLQKTATIQLPHSSSISTENTHAKTSPDISHSTSTVKLENVGIFSDKHSVTNQISTPKNEEDEEKTRHPK